MLRPEGGSGGQVRRGTPLAAILLLAVGASPSFVAHAAVPQDAAFGKLSVLSATATPGPDRIAADRSGLPSPTRALRLAGTLEEAYGPEERAQELYLDAMEKLDAGRREWAQKMLESLIAGFPQTAAAALARGQLGALYRAGATQAATAPSAKVTKAAAPTMPPSAAPTIGSSPQWEQELRRNASIQAKLRADAGDRVFFSAGSAELGSRARGALSAQARWLNRWHEFEAAIEGHADEPGTREENLSLSEARAEAVRRRLVEEGVEASRLAIVAQGRTQRVAPCKGPLCAAQNRRVVTHVFASGTSERLGLTAVSAVKGPAAPVVRAAETPPAPAATEQVGVAR